MADQPAELRTDGENEIEISWSEVTESLFKPWRVDGRGGGRPSQPTYAVMLESVGDMTLVKALAVDSCDKAKELEIVDQVDGC